MRDYVSACIAEHLQNAEHDRISQSMWTDKKAFKSVMRYSMTLKNALDHFVNTATEKQNLQRTALSVLAWLQLH